MEPEPGDPKVRVTRAEVAAAARQAGIVPGDLVLFHSSLSSMGHVVGGPDTVIDGFLEAVGPRGTVAVPTLCNWLPEEQGQVYERWDPATSPSYVGRITEHFRHRPDAVRSDQATHSVAAIGARAAELTADHGAFGRRQCPFGDRAFALSSPWQKLVAWNGAYCFIGVNFWVGTMVHFVESLIVERALAKVDADRREAFAGEVAGWMKDGVWPSIRADVRVTLEPALAAKGLMGYAKIGSATLRCVRGAEFVDGMLQAAAADPETWLSEGFRAWLARIEQGGAA